VCLRALVLTALVGLLGPQGRWIAIGAGLGLLVVVANVALAGMSAYLISRAAIVTNVADVALAVTAVRVLAISRAAFRYLEPVFGSIRREREWLSLVPGRFFYCRR
jgi:ATP-binding cassette subfamily C protein CydC